jgi:Domain of unknown function (DUF6134)
MKHHEMKMLWAKILTSSMAIIFLSSWLAPSRALAAEEHNNHFASILLDNKKIGTVHFSVKHNEKGQLEQVKTKASLSVFGVKLYDFTHNLHEEWSDGKLQSMRSHANENGKIDEITLQRGPTQYVATRNDERLTLPHTAFPLSLWHHGVVQQSLLFDVTTLRLMKVETMRHEDTVIRDGKSTPAERVTFTGEWRGNVWYDQKKRFLRAEYMSEGRLIVVVMDP